MVLARLDNDRTRTLMLLAALTALALALDLWQVSARRAGRTIWFESVVCAISSPLQTALLGTVQFAEREWTAAVGARQLGEENARLQARVAELEDRLSHLTEDRLAAQRARLLLSAPAASRQRRLAHVIGLGEGGWSELMTVDLGRAGGVRQREVAVTAAGVVGQVVAVAPHSARLLPLTNPISAISVRLQRSRDAGVLKGLGHWRCEVRYLDPQADVRVGDLVITSGLGGIFPAGLRVGAVTSVRKDRETPGKAAEVRPTAQLRRIEEVVLLSARE
jgi:rod shape-determining protein MreC